MIEFTEEEVEVIKTALKYIIEDCQDIIEMNTKFKNLSARGLERVSNRLKLSKNLLEKVEKEELK